jgi:hypothetical protein
MQHCYSYCLSLSQNNCVGTMNARERMIAYGQISGHPLIFCLVATTAT